MEIDCKGFTAGNIRPMVLFCFAVLLNESWCYLWFVECDPNCDGSCHRGTGKCDADCKDGYSLVTAADAYTCASTLRLNISDLETNKQ